MSNPPVTINLVVLNGEKYIRHCLDGILAQTYPHELIEFNILDNGSLDNTANIIENAKFKNQNIKFLKWDLIKSKQNLGMWPGQEELLQHSNGKYILAVAVDVILNIDFIKNAVEAMDKDDKIGALEAKIYKYDLVNNNIIKTTILDTCGFKIFKSRRIINIGHGEKDNGQYDDLGYIFAVEGAAPFFRKEALKNCKIEVGPRFEIVDHDFFWYGDDLDLAWRMNLFGWKQIFAPSVIAWHDRQTTKKLRGSFADFRAIRSTLPLSKRQLEWKNIRFTIIKNDYIISILKDLPRVLKREAMMFGYLMFFEPKVLLEIPNFLRLLPKMLRKRKEIMRKSKVSPKEMERWFT